LARSEQEQKYILGLSGEFLVAGELLRRNIRAAVTYGNAKKADVVAVNGRSACSIEVKTTQQPKWNIGNKIPEANDSIWVLVYLPPDEIEPVEFFVLTGFELNVILKPIQDAWLKKCMEKHGRPMPGVYSVSQEQIESHKGAWQKVRAALGQGRKPSSQ
jgi:hypothetical protein